MMKNLNAEAHVLDRITYLLEEVSVTNLMREDSEFARYINGLYLEINTKSWSLENSNIAR